MTWTRVTHHWCHEIGAEIVLESGGYVVWLWNSDGGGHQGIIGTYATLAEAKAAAEAEAALQAADEKAWQRRRVELERSLFGEAQTP